MRHPARGFCFWYPAVHVARAAASCRYRIGNLTEHLWGADVVVGQRLPSSMQRGLKAISVIRPLPEPGVARDLERLRAGGTRLIGDFDDLLFAGPVRGLPRSVSGKDETSKRERLALYRRALELFDHFTVSTRALSQRLAELAPEKPRSLVPNGLSARWVEQGRALHQPWRPGDPRIIRYFAGSPSHDRDFDSIVPVLVRFLQEHPSVRLEIVGPVACDWARFPAGRLTLHPPLAHAALPRLLAKSWVNLAPLAPSPFTACKSAIKFLEAGAFQCPTLASPHDDLLRHQEQGAPAILCQTADDWHRQLTALLDDEQRTTHGQSIAGYVDQHGMARASAAIWAHALAQGVS